MKTLLFATCLLFISSVHAQTGDDLMVYSMKGTVTVIENSIESKAKIGKVLKPGSTIKTQKLAKLTMVCKQGKPLTVTKEGIFPVTKWKDSCESNNDNSVTTKYFQYIWEQLSLQNNGYKKNKSGDIGAVSKNEAPIRGEDDMEILFNEQLDTVCYATGNFPLSWKTSSVYRGKYFFRLADTKTGTIIFSDSMASSSIRIDLFKRRMKIGGAYQWSVATKLTGVYAAGVINYVSPKTVSQQIIIFQKAIDVPEDIAARYFRTAYLLQQNHYLADAYLYYQKAVNAAPDVIFYKEQLNMFEKEFQLQKF